MFAALAPLAACHADGGAYHWVAPVSRTPMQLAEPAPTDDGNFLPSYVAQCESVLGPIPRISCDPAHPAEGTEVTKIPVFVDGKLLGFKEPLTESERALLATRAAMSDYSCDFPSIGGDFPCSIGSTLVRYQSETNPNVQWVGLCRGLPRDTPGYDRFIGNGLIGANVKTGEMCFFFGVNPNQNEPYVLPALRSDATSNAALAPWRPPREMPGSCISCHPNNDPWILTPWLMPSYMEPVLADPEYALSLPVGTSLEDVMAARFITTTPTSLQTTLPKPLPAERSAWTEEEVIGPNGEVKIRQYRIVGSSYVDVEANGQVEARTGLRPDTWAVSFRDRIRVRRVKESCSAGCHAMGNEFWQTLAADSVGTKYAARYLSASQKRHDHVWMPPYDYERVADLDLDDSLVSAISECPIPKRFKEEVGFSGSCDGPVTVEWRYVNDFGGVPGRDDIRFDVALSDDLEWTGGNATNNDIEGARMSGSDRVSITRDVAPDKDGYYHLELPDGVPQDNFVISLQPKRYCFEEPQRRVFSYARPLRVYVDRSRLCKEAEAAAR